MDNKTQTDPQTYQIIGCAMEVHKHLGCGFLESVYQEAMAIEMCSAQIFYSAEVNLPIYYKKTKLSSHYRADFVCFNEIILEIKAIERLSSIEESQVINYLNASGMKRALLINFGASSLEYKRMVLNYSGHHSDFYSENNLRSSAPSAGKTNGRLFL